jgi:hypothetical protein
MARACGEHPAYNGGVTVQPITPSTTRHAVMSALLEAVGSSATPFVPLPFVDDWIVRRIFRRVARKTVRRHGVTDAKLLAKRIVKGYVAAGKSGMMRTVANVTTRFIVRKFAVALDVKKSHDVFSETIAFAVALEVCCEHGWHFTVEPKVLGKAIYRAVREVGGKLLETIGGAGSAAFGDIAADATERASHMARAADAVSAELESKREALSEALSRSFPSIKS